jgi:four helix bundle protein
MMPFVFERLDAYQRARRWVLLSIEIEKTGKGFVPASLLDQLNRASSSIPLNLAEGCGRWQRADKQKFYQIALGSVYESAAVIQLLLDRRVISDDQYQKCYQCLTSLGQLINGLIRSVKERPRSAKNIPELRTQSDNKSKSNSQ